MLHKWLPAFAMMLVSVISYIDRSTLAVLIPSVMKETGLSAAQYGTIVSAFAAGYFVGNPVWGQVLDRIGVRAGMLLAVSLWTLASASHALVGGFVGFFAARLVLGFGEGATFPGALRTCVQTLDPVSRGRGTALSYSGGSLGAIITPLVVTPIFAAFGWRAAFWFTGLVGGLWLVLWWFLSRRPDIRQLPERAAGTPRISFGDPRVWAFFFLYALGNVPLGFVVNMSSIYLTKQFGLAQGELGKLLWIPPAGWECGYFFWGWLLDRRARAAGNRASIYPGIFLLGLALMLPFALIPHTGSLAITMGLYFLTMFATGAYIIPAVSYATDVFTDRQAGLIAGIGAGSFSASVFVLSPVFGRMLDGREFSAAFLLATLFPAVGFLIWKGLSSRMAKS